MSKKEISIPKELKNFLDILEFIFGKINERYSALRSIEKAGSEHAEQLGNWLILLKKAVKKHGKDNWTDVLKERCPHISVRTAQRWMKLARQANLEESPVLAYLGKTALYDLTELAGKEDLASYLSSCGFDVKIDPADKATIEDLKGQLEEYIGFCKSLSNFQPRNKGCDKEDKDTTKENETKQKGEEKPKSDNKNIIAKLTKSATSFIEGVDLVLNDEKVLASHQDELSEIIKEVEEKIAGLEYFRASIKRRKAAKKKRKKNAERRKSANKRKVAKRRK